MTLTLTLLLLAGLSLALHGGWVFHRWWGRRRFIQSLERLTRLPAFPEDLARTRDVGRCDDCLMVYHLRPDMQKGEERQCPGCRGHIRAYDGEIPEDAPLLAPRFLGAFVTTSGTGFRIVNVNYDGDGKWLRVYFSDGSVAQYDVVEPELGHPGALVLRELREASRL